MSSNALSKIGAAAEALTVESGGGGVALNLSNSEFAVSGWFRAHARRICFLFFVLVSVVPTIAEAQAPLLTWRNRLEEAVPVPNHVRFVYALPADGVDRDLDVNGTLQAAVVVAQNWMAERADGMKLRIRMVDGRPEILFVKLDIQQDTPDAAKRADEERRIADDRLRDGIELQLRRDRRINPNEIYAVLYDGIHFGGCGVAPGFPKLHEGVVVLLPLRGYGASMAVGCSALLLAPPQRSETQPERVLLFHISLLHEIFHALGAVPDCAPDRMKRASEPMGLARHVNVNPNDLMYAPSTPGPNVPVWTPTEIDAKRRNYFGHGRSDCLDVAKSPFLVRAR